MDVQNNFSDTDPAYSLFNVTHTSTKPLLVTVELNENSVDMEVDTVASVSLISKDTYDKLWPNLTTAPPLQESDILLRTYTGEHLDVVGSVSIDVRYKEHTPPIDVRYKEHTAPIDVRYKEHTAHLPLTVVAGRGPSLLGQDWLQHIKLDWKALHLVGTPPTLASLLDHHKALFHDKLGTVKGTSAKLHVDPQTWPRFYKPCPVPYAMQERVEREIGRLKQEGIFQPVEFSDWAAPIVPVLKNDGLSVSVEITSSLPTRQQKWTLTHCQE